ncbi:MAG: hypothetical protein ACRDJN_26955 [Chloroflexota bacterium]
MPINAIRIRRDFAKLLALITASAVLHQRRREKDGDGRIVATLDDYALVREVTTDAYAAAQDAGVRPVHRQTLDAFKAACVKQGWPAREDTGVGHNALAKRLRIDKGTLTVRMRVLLREGYATDLNARPDGRPARGRPARYVPGDDLPEQESQLPAREAVEALMRGPRWRRPQRRGAAATAGVETGSKTPTLCCLTPTPQITGALGRCWSARCTRCWTWGVQSNRCHRLDRTVGAIRRPPHPLQHTIQHLE